jgi:hypothetical protein
VLEARRLNILVHRQGVDLAENVQAGRLPADLEEERSRVAG